MAIDNFFFDKGLNFWFAVLQKSNPRIPMPEVKSLPNLMDNPKFKALIDGFSEVIQTSAEKGLDAARKRCTEFFLSGTEPRIEIESIQNLTIPGSDQHPIPLRIYDPSGAKNLPVIVYFHRGGWIFGNIEEADPVCRLLAHHLECVVVSVDFRLSPENPFPKPLDDCYAATVWASQQFDNQPLIVCGESCGGNLAAAVALMARDRKGPPIAQQLLIYPIITSTICDEPYDNCVDQHFITKGGMQFMWGAYLGSPENGQNPYASVELADSSNLPPAVVITAEYDPLCLEGELYGEKLRKAGGEVRVKRFPEVVHGFLDLPLYDLEQKIAWAKEIKKLLAEACCYKIALERSQ